MRKIGFIPPLSNKVMEENKTKGGSCYYGSKSVECCEILSLFAKSHAKKNIVENDNSQRSKEEEKWFNDFTFRFFEVLKEKINILKAF